MPPLLFPAAALLALVSFAVGNMLGAAVLRARGFGLISIRRETPASRWRGPVARLAGPLGLYVLTCAIGAVSQRYAQVPTSKVEVVPGFPAAAAGLKPGDRVVQVAGEEVTTFPALANRITSHGHGAPVELVVRRGDDRITATVTTDAEGRIGVRPSSEMQEGTWGQAILQALPLPIRVAASIPRLLAILVGGQRETVLIAPSAIQGSDDRARALALVYAFALNLALLWAPLTLLALLTQVVAWRRGELRAPAATGS